MRISDHAFETLLSRILGSEASTLQGFIDELMIVFEHYHPRSVAIYSARLKDSNVLELIAATGERPLDLIVIVADNQSLADPSKHSIYEARGEVLSLRIRTRQTIPQRAILREVILARVAAILNLRRQGIRRAVIEHSARSKDLDSFIFRCVRTLKSEYIFAEEISAVIPDARQKKIYLSATTSEIHRIKKKDFFYQLSDKFPTVQAFLANWTVIEEKPSSFVREEFDGNLSPLNLYSRAFWPLAVMNPKFSTRGGGDFREHIAPLGVLRVSNPRRRDGKQFTPTYFTKFDEFTIAFVSEVMFVLVQKYIQFVDAESDMARLTHGLGANIDAAIKFATSLKEALYEEGDEDGAAVPTFELKKAEAAIGYTADTIYFDFRELEYFLGDLQFQFTKMHGKNFDPEVIDNLHADVLMPALRMTPAIAAVNSKVSPLVARFRDRGSLSLPKTIGNKEAYISFLRNLFENSIKYTRKRRASIDVGFSVEPDFVVLDYQDDGIGIQANEREQVFVEGYRSVAARRLNNRGVGIGLSYSRDVMKSFEGELECLEKVGGARFRLKIRRSK
jgi:hypothetical protein